MHTQINIMRTVSFRFAYLILLYGAMFDFADVTETAFCVGTFNLPIASAVHWRLLSKRYTEGWF